MTDFSKVKVGDKVITGFRTRETPFIDVAEVVKVHKQYFVVELNGTKREYNMDGRRRGLGREAWHTPAPARPYEERLIQRVQAAKGHFELVESVEKQTDRSSLEQMNDDELIELLEALLILSGKREARKLAEDSASIESNL